MESTLTIKSCNAKVLLVGHSIIVMKSPFKSIIPTLTRPLQLENRWTSPWYANVTHTNQELTHACVVSTLLSGKRLQLYTNILTLDCRRGDGGKHQLKPMSTRWRRVVRVYNQAPASVIMQQEQWGAANPLQTGETEVQKYLFKTTGNSAKPGSVKSACFGFSEDRMGWESALFFVPIKACSFVHTLFSPFCAAATEVPCDLRRTYPLCRANKAVYKSREHTVRLT